MCIVYVGVKLKTPFLSTIMETVREKMLLFEGASFQGCKVKITVFLMI